MTQKNQDVRLIERWLPIAELSEEGVRERRSFTALPPTYYLHVWWARRPLVASRAAVLASLLPADADRERFLHVLGIQSAANNSEHQQANNHGRKRAFSYTPDAADQSWISSLAPNEATVLDLCGGGGVVYRLRRFALDLVFLPTI